MYNFPEKRPDEKVLRMLKRHKIFFLKPIIYGLIIIILAFLPFYFLNLESWLAIVIVLIAMALVGIIFWYYRFLWGRDYYILTDQRLIDINQGALFSRTFNEIPLDKIQDVTYQVIGLLATVFNFGNIIIKTAGPVEDRVVEMISDPAQITQELSSVFKTFREVKGLIKDEKIVNTDPEGSGAPILGGDKL